MTSDRAAELAATAVIPLLVSPFTSEFEPVDAFAGLQFRTLTCAARTRECLRRYVVPVTAVILCHVPVETGIGGIVGDFRLLKVS